MFQEINGRQHGTLHIACVRKDTRKNILYFTLMNGDILQQEYASKAEMDKIYKNYIDNGFFIEINGIVYNIIYFSTVDKYDCADKFMTHIVLRTGEHLHVKFDNIKDRDTFYDEVTTIQLVTKKEAAPFIKQIDYDGEYFTFTFTSYDGTTKKIDLPVESTVKSGSYDKKTKEIVLKLVNNKEVRIPVNDLVDVYIGSKGEVVDIDVANKAIQAKVKEGSVKEELLSDEVQTKLNRIYNFDGDATSEANMQMFAEIYASEEPFIVRYKNMVMSDFERSEGFLRLYFYESQYNMNVYDGITCMTLKRHDVIYDGEHINCKTVTTYHMPSKIGEVASKKYVDSKIKVEDDKEVEDVSSLTEKYNNLSSKVDAIETNLNNLQDEHSTLASNVSTIETNLGSLTGQHEALSSKVTGIEENVSNLTSKQNSLESQVGDLDTDYSSLATEQSSLKSTVEGLSTKEAEDIKTLTTEQSNLKSTIEGLSTKEAEDIKTLETKYTSVSTKQEEVDGVLTDLNGKYDSLSSSQTTINSTISELEARIVALESQINP